MLAGWRPGDPWAIPSAAADAAESDALIGRKLGRASRAGLRPILCVGEQLAGPEAGHAPEVVAGQLPARLAARTRTRCSVPGS